jgi:hypothetical protein
MGRKKPGYLREQQSVRLRKTIDSTQLTFMRGCSTDTCEALKDGVGLLISESLVPKYFRVIKSPTIFLTTTSPMSHEKAKGIEVGNEIARVISSPESETKFSPGAFCVAYTERNVFLRMRIDISDGSQFATDLTSLQEVLKRRRIFQSNSSPYLDIARANRSLTDSAETVNLVDFMNDGNNDDFWLPAVCSSTGGFIVKNSNVPWTQVETGGHYEI